MHALILDDEPGIGRVICRIARLAGFTAEAATDAVDFQMRFSLENPDVVLLDLQLAGDDGLAQLRFLAEQHYPHAVVLMSGHAPRVLSSAERRGRDLGLDILASISKPFGTAELTALFESLATRPISSSTERST